MLEREVEPEARPEHQRGDQHRVPRGERRADAQREAVPGGPAPDDGDVDGVDAQRRLADRREARGRRRGHRRERREQQQHRADAVGDEPGVRGGQVLEPGPERDGEHGRAGQAERHGAAARVGGRGEAHDRAGEEVDAPRQQRERRGAAQRLRHGHPEPGRRQLRRRGQHRRGRPHGERHREHAQQREHARLLARRPGQRQDQRGDEQRHADHVEGVEREEVAPHRRVADAELVDAPPRPAQPVADGEQEQHAAEPAARDVEAAGAAPADRDRDRPAGDQHEQRRGEAARLPVQDHPRRGPRLRREQRVERVAEDHGHHAHRAGGVERRDAGGLRGDREAAVGQGAARYSTERATVQAKRRPRGTGRPPGAPRAAGTATSGRPSRTSRPTSPARR
ncbi:hypothetical protein Adeh_1426 [Anaeromyxobacter dehalogenans 2CP-C]|uniref:Uncharacterized protein n=1 Tax=Anaeromyxobacter dehalogenans (strain 2CP-C) TaxID=290397 RepID=Q2IHR9_ANADE|nr:hypothetical protein Adeh_1426 [Anaeromyxobacter dehalogenans 2CP-C]